MLFDVLNPRGTAGREEGPSRFGFEAFEEFRGFLDDGHIRGDVGIVDFREAYAPERGDEFAEGIFRRRDAEGVAHRDPDRRGDLDGNFDVFVRQQSPYFIGIVSDHERAGGTDRGALTATDADGFAYGFIVDAGDFHFGPSVGEIDGADFLDFIAHSDATSAGDTLGGVFCDALGRFVEFGDRVALRIAHFGQIESEGEFLQFAGGAFLAGGAIATVVRREEFENVFAVHSELFGVGFDDHPGFGEQRAGRVQRTAPSPLVNDFDQAHTARAVDGQFRAVAEGGDVDADLLGVFQHVQALFEFDRHTVNRDKLFVSHCYASSFMALDLHFSMQAKHLMHFVWSRV
jgi:hypothetical protein